MSSDLNSMVMFSQGTTKMHMPPGFSLGNNAFSSSSGLRVCSRALLEIIKSAILSGKSTTEEKTSTPFFVASAAAVGFTSIPILRFASMALNRWPPPQPKSIMKLFG